jgi:DNA-binding NarL/FixJ family response regulator
MHIADHSTSYKTAPFWRFFADVRARAAAESGGVVNVSRPKILIVEDNFLLSMQMEDALTDVGFHVVGRVASAEQALTCARKTRPDLMVVDIRLEGERDGISAATQIYAELGIRSIFASSFSAQDLRERSAEARPVAWISKPFDMDTLVKLVRDGLLPEIQN